MADESAARVHGGLQGLRRRAGPVQGRLRGPPRRGHGARRRQRRRQVDARSRASPGSTRSTRGRSASRASRVDIHSPREAAQLGIEVVYQDLALADNLDVVANMFLGRERTRYGLVLDEPTMERARQETLAQPLGHHAAVGAPAVTGLSGGQRQAVAVAKSVMWNSKLRHPRRAHRRPRRGADPAGARPGPPAGRAGPRRGDHLPQPARHLRGRRPDHRAAPRPAGGGARAGRDHPAGGRACHHGRRPRAMCRAWPTPGSHEP